MPGAASFFKLRWAMRGILIVDDFPSEVWLAADVARNLGVSPGKRSAGFSSTCS